MQVLNNYHNIKKQIEILNKKTNLIVVTKGQNLETIKIILDAGHLHFGENRVQEASLKWSKYLANNSNINLHMIGRLQSNKAKEAINIFNYIHSLDNENLAQTLSKLEKNYEKKINYFIQINIGEEKQKSGVELSKAIEFANYCMFDLKLNVLGLMCIPPVNEKTLFYFNKLKDLNDQLNLNNLSMGMSNDYEEAIKCGANYVRIGSAIFGSLN